MNDSKKMGIGDIERHKYNYRLFCQFIKQEKKYAMFKKLMFTDFNRTPIDLFKEIDKADVTYILFKLSDKYCDIDRKWCGVFSYSPFCKFNWGK